MIEPTEQQAAVLHAVREFWREQGIGPTVRELAVRFGWNTNGVVCHLTSLARKGRLEWSRDGKARQIWPVGLRAAIRELAANSPATTAG